MFLDEQFIEAYNEGETVLESVLLIKAKLDEVLPSGGVIHKTEGKRILNAYNLAVDTLRKKSKHRYCPLRRLEMSEIFEV